MNRGILSESDKTHQEEATPPFSLGQTSDKEFIRQELEKVLKSPLFTRSSRLSRFLRFVVEKTLLEETHTLKEYALAVEVFDKEESYEPGVDPLVRVEAGRLRNKLREYYEKEGQEALVRIDLPKGSYVPTFQWRQTITPNTLIAADTEGASAGGEKLISDQAQPPSLASSPTTSIGETDSIADQTLRPRTRISRVAILVTLPGILFLIVLLASSYWRKNFIPTPVQAKIQSIVVTPLENLSGDPNQEYFADGMTYALRRNLTQIKGLMVIRWPKKPLPEVTRELNADWILGGAVVQTGDRVRIDAQLIERATDRILWATSYQGDMKNILSLQDDVTRDIATEIAIKLTPQEQERLSGKRPQVNPESYEAYLKGRYFMEKWEDEGFEKAAEAFQEAIRLDPQNALAYAELSNTYGSMVFRSSVAPAIGWRKAEAAAIKAVELDDTSPEAHVAMAGVIAYFHCDPIGAKREYKRAFELNPNSGQALAYHAWFLVQSGRFEEAIAEKKRSLLLDPVSSLENSELGMILLEAHRTDEAIRQLQKTIDMDPNFAAAHGRLGGAYRQAGQFELAVFEVKKGIALNPTPQRLESLVDIYREWGKPAEARQALSELVQMSKHRYVPPDLIARVYAKSGENEQSLRWLEKTSEDDMPDLSCPEFDGQRSNPRFHRLEERFKPAKSCS
jgi:TolB-like protein/Flp pilus assembly protein TadD